jgi:hypothetical protein
MNRLEKRISDTATIRPVSSINRSELRKAIRPNLPDTAGETAKKESETNKHHAPGSTKEPQQKNGAWCPACKHFHRPDSTCIEATKPPKAP